MPVTDDRCPVKGVAMESMRTGWQYAMAALLVTTAVGCGSAELVYYPDDPVGTGSGGSGGSGGSAGTTSSGVAACEGQCVPLGPVEWLGPALLWIGKENEAPECPPTAPVDSALMYNELNAPNVCASCECAAPTGSCALPTALTAASSQCPGDAAGVAHTSFDAPAGWSGACTTEDSIPANQKCNGVACVQSLTIAPITLTEAPCAVSTTPIASKQPYVWGTAALACHGSAAGSCMGAAEVCTPPAPDGFKQCLLQRGDNECPSAYPQKHLFYKGFTDTRSCTPCACSTPVGSTCSAQVSIFKDSACSAPILTYAIGASGPKCLDMLSGVALGSKLATEPVYTPGVCQVSGGEAIGEAVPEELSTFCCLPP